MVDVRGHSANRTIKSKRAIVARRLEVLHGVRARGAFCLVTGTSFRKVARLHFELSGDGRPSSAVIARGTLASGVRVANTLAIETSRALDTVGFRIRLRLGIESTRRTRLRQLGALFTEITGRTHATHMRQVSGRIRQVERSRGVAPGYAIETYSNKKLNDKMSQRSEFKK